MAIPTASPGRNPDRYRAATQDRVADIMSERFDLPATEPRRRFVFIAEPRSGGSFLAEALRATGTAGVPYEYLNQRLIEAYATRFGLTARPTTAQYFGHLLRHRTTPNGVFMLKALVDQVAPSLPRRNAVSQFLAGCDRVFVLRRNDKLAQAVSFYKASVSDAWNSQDRFDGYDDPARFPFDPVAITQFLRALFTADRQLDEVVAWARERNKPVEIFTYEKIDRDFESEWARLLQFLELPPVPVASLGTTLERQRDAVSDALMAQYIAEIRGQNRPAGAVPEKPR
jgi:LPS sulfotransferase NodH